MNCLAPTFFLLVSTDWTTWFYQADHWDKSDRHLIHSKMIDFASTIVLSNVGKLKCIKPLTLLLSLPFHEDHGMKQNKSKTNHDYCAFESFGLSRGCFNVRTAGVILIKKQTRLCQLKTQEETCKKLLSTASTVETNEKFLFFIFIWAVIRCQDVCNWAISNWHLNLRGNRSTDGKQNLLVSFLKAYSI